MISFHIVNYLHNRAVFFWHTIQNKRIAMFDDWIPLPVRMVFGWEIIESVSYTHLDVYKRQAIMYSKEYPFMRKYITC